MAHHDFRAAIACLEASTSAIERQGEVLKVQQQYLTSLKKQGSDENASRTKRLAIQNLHLTVGKMLLAICFL
jgi:hypothetical protein